MLIGSQIIPKNVKLRNNPNDLSNLFNILVDVKSFDFGSSITRGQDSCNDPNHCALTSSIMAQNAKQLSVFNFKIHTF